MNSQLTFTPSAVDAFACTLDGVTATGPDGLTAPLDKCAWMQVCPCGCVSGITTAVQGRGQVVLASADAALRNMAANATDAKEDAKLGYRMVLIRMSDYRGNASLLDLMKTSCPHDPKWGHQRKTRDVGGKTWTRIGSTEWRHVDDDGGYWRLEKYSGYWHMMPSSKFIKSGMRVPGMGSTLDEALDRGSAYVDELSAVKP